MAQMVTLLWNKIAHKCILCVLAQPALNGHLPIAVGFGWLQFMQTYSVLGMHTICIAAHHRIHVHAYGHIMLDL